LILLFDNLKVFDLDCLLIRKVQKQIRVYNYQTEGSAKLFTFWLVIRKIKFESDSDFEKEIDEEY